MKKVFIDGSAGTTGLRIYERLCMRKDIELVSLPDEIRKDFNARKDIINSSDIVFLCLPDDAARESVSMIENPDVCIIDTSTAHRTAEGWTYGFPEIGGRYEKVASSKRVANPGCHASGFISLVAPLVEMGILKKGCRSHLLLAHRLLRRRKEDDSPVPGFFKGCASRCSQAVWTDAEAQAPAGDGSRLGH